MSAEVFYLHAVPDTKIAGKWLLVTSDQRDAVTINAKVVAEGMHEDTARALALAYSNADMMLRALAPFAWFAERWDRNPLRGTDDNFYSIHSGEAEAKLRVSDCRAALAAIETVSGKPFTVKP